MRETMFPGEAHEMTNLYHMDGGDLVITHYCTVGNQPRMVASKAVETDDGTVFHFELESVSNLRESHDHYMGDMTLTIHKSGGLRQDWRSYDRDGVLTDPMVFMLSRTNRVTLKVRRTALGASFIGCCGATHFLFRLRVSATNAWPGSHPDPKVACPCGS